MDVLNLPQVQWLEANGDSITSVWRNGERLWVYPHPVIDLEANLTLTNSFAVGSTDWVNSVSRNSRGIFALDITGMTATEGIIWEVGGSGTGATTYVKDGQLIIRAGNGGNTIPMGECSSLIVDCPTGDGILVMGIEFGSGYSGNVKLWWDGQPLYGTTQSGMNDLTLWAGSDSAAYMADSTGVPVGVPTTAFTGYSTISSLRYYQDQVIS